MDVTIYHNQACSTSRAVLGMIREAGIEPRIVEYLKEGYSRETLTALLGRMGLSARDAVRRKEAKFAELGLAEAGEEALIAAMVAHPILVERPIVATPKGTRLCRPADRLAGLL